MIQTQTQYKVRGKEITTGELYEEACDTFAEARSAALAMFQDYTQIEIVKSDERDAVAKWELVGRKLVKVK